MTTITNTQGTLEKLMTEAFKNGDEWLVAMIGGHAVATHTIANTMDTHTLVRLGGAQRGFAIERRPPTSALAMDVGVPHLDLLEPEPDTDWEAAGVQLNTLNELGAVLQRRTEEVRSTSESTAQTLIDIGKDEPEDWEKSMIIANESAKANVIKKMDDALAESIAVIKQAPPESRKPASKAYLDGLQDVVKAISGVYELYTAAVYAAKVVQNVVDTVGKALEDTRKEIGRTTEKIKKKFKIRL